MGNYVLLLADRDADYVSATFRERESEQQGLAVISRWAQHLESIGARDTSTRRGGLPVRISRFEYLRRGEFRIPLDQRLPYIIERVMAGYRRAVELAGTGGRIGLAFGHGLVRGREATLDLAPGGWFTIDTRFVEEVYWHRLHPDVEDRTRTLEKQAFTAIGDLFRGTARRPRIDRVDLYACWVGFGGGQQFLDALHHLWGVPIRGLRGPLVFEGSILGPPAVAYVEPPTNELPPTHAFRRPFRGELVEGAGLWASSRNRPPALRAEP